MKSLNMIIFLIVLLFWSTGICQDTGTTGSTFLKLGAGARAIGMGSAFTGLSDDATAIYWNPAGLGFIKRWELAFNYQRLFGDFDYQALFYSHQLRLLASRKAAIGIGIIHLGTNNGWNSTDPKYNIPDVSAGEVSDLVVILPFAYRLDWLSPKFALGMNYKYVKNKLANYTSHSHGLDFSFMFKTALFDRLFFSLGTTLQNITLKKVKFIEEAESLPLALRVGSAMKFYLTDRQDITLAYDIFQSSDNNMKHNFGVEYWLHLGIHRFGVRGGYRLLDKDLGKLAFSVGYGLDIGQMSQNSYFSQVDYALNNYNNDILGNVNLASFSLEPSNPGPFRRLLPEVNAQFISKTEYMLTWEKTEDYDDHDWVKYFVVVDKNYDKVKSIKDNAKEIVKQISKEPTSLDILFHKQTSNTSVKFEYHEDSDVQDFYWAVIAYDRNVNITIATGSDEIGKFRNKNLPDIRAVSLSFTSATQLDTSKYQGELEAKIVGLVKKPCKVVIYDSTDSKIICSEEITQLSVPDTFTFGGEWWSSSLGEHKLSLIADFENAIDERNETNNVFARTFPTIPYGTISVADTLKLEELSYERIDLPIIPFIFFEPNSTQFSKNSRVNNETDPDSLLKLFGERLLRDYPGLKIAVRGFVAPNSEARTSDGKRLSFLRAQKVKQKLIEYGARESQILLPQNHVDIAPRLEQKSTKLDSLEQEMVNEENRRVEISLPENLPSLKRVEYEKRFFAPRVIIRSKNEILSEKIKFQCQLQSSIPLKALTILIKDQKADPFPIKIIHVDTLSREESLNFALIWDGIKDNDQLLAFNKSYYYSAFVVDETGKQYLAPLRKFYVARDVIVKQKRIFALAKFNRVAPLHQFYLEQLDQVETMMIMEPRIRIRFYGHTDIIGTEERNDELSTDRAVELAGWLAKIIEFDYRLTDSLKQQLKSRIDTPFSKDHPDFEQKFAFGKGEHEPLIARNIEYGINKAPQGRTLDRRVDIEVYRMGDFQKPELVIEKNIVFHPWYHKLYPMILSLDVGQDYSSLAPTHLASTVMFEMPQDSRSEALSSQEDQDTLQIKGISDEMLDTLKTSERQNAIIDSLKAQVSASDAPATLQPHTPPFEKLVSEAKMTGKVEIRASLANRITCIELQDSLLWIGTDNGLIKWNLRNDTYKIIGLDLEKYKYITSLKYDFKEQCLWVGTRKGLRKLKGEDWVADFNVGKGLSGNIINAIVIDKSDRLLLGTNEGINISDKERWEILANVDHGLTDDHVNDIYIDGAAKLWACTNNGVCYRTVEGNWLAFEWNAALPSDTVLCMVIDSQENKWFGTTRGLCMFNKNNQLTQFMTFDMAHKLTIDGILSLAEDETRTLWCATKHGLSIFKKGVWFTYDYRDGLPASFVNTIFAGRDHKIYVGTNGGGLSILRSTEQKLKPVVDKR